MRILLVLLLGATAMRAEFLHIEVFITDMNCESCTDTLANAFKKMRGVDHVDIDFKAGTVALSLTAQNRLGLEQVWDAIKRVGFTPGETTVHVRGTVKASKIAVTGIDKTFEIEGDAVEGDNVQVSGSITPPPDPRTPIRIRTGK